MKNQIREGRSSHEPALRTKGVPAGVRTIQTLGLMMLAAGMMMGIHACSVVKTVGGALGDATGHAKGGYYLDERKYDEGAKAFQERLKENPNDGVAHFYMGRYRLGQNKPQEALVHLKKAAEINPGTAENHFWLGVAYWGVKDYAKERTAYQKAIQIDLTHVPAHVYLGHNYYDRKEYAKALETYDKALKLDPYQPEALYGRSNALGKLGRGKEEVQALKTYLGYYPDGSLSREAVDRLNGAGDFSYRNFTIGPRVVTLNYIQFAPKTTELTVDAKTSLRVVGNLMESNKKVKIRVESYYLGNQGLAQGRAEAVRDHLTKNFSGVDPARIQIQTFGRAERVRTTTKAYELNSSIVLETTK
jgi:tetratricopeptide (TPR) repeat protein